MNDFRLGYVYFNNQRYLGDANMLRRIPGRDGYGMTTGVTNPLYGGFPEITFTGFHRLFGSLALDGPSTRGPEGNVDLVENVSYLHGKHTFKFGFEYVDILFDQKDAGNILATRRRHHQIHDLGKFPPGTTNGGTIF